MGRAHGIMQNTLRICRLPGRIPYGQALDMQRRLARLRIAGELEDDVVLLLEHEPVVTLGRGSRDDNIVASGLLAARGIETVEIERGGDVTYHGPGQLVGYPIIDLKGYRKDLHWYVRRLEDVLIGTLSRLGLEAFRAPGLTGVWVGEDGEAETLPLRVGSGRARKIASIGVHVSRWVTWHGFALNVTREPLDNFRLIVPCGIDGVRMTCLEAEGAAADLDEANVAVRRGLAEAFDVRVVDLTPEAIAEALGDDSISRASTATPQ